MLGQICQYLRNWFDYDSRHNRLPSWSGEITIAGGELVGFSDRLLNGQYFRVIDSALNDGVYQYGVDTLQDETFDGTIQSMRIPPVFLALAKEIDEWQKKYGGADSTTMSPFSAESFGGYSYTKAQGFASTGGGMLTSWESVYAARLAPYRKI